LKSIFKIIISFAIVLSNLFVQAQSKWLYLHPDSNDIEAYTLTLENCGFNTYGYSRWEHAMAGNGEIAAHDFIIKTVPFGKYNLKKSEFKSTSFQYGRGDWQLKMLGLDSFHKLGYTGKGVTIALMDVGYYKVDSFAAFDSLWKNNQIKYWYDFVDNDSTVFNAGSHGMSVLSLIGGNIPDSLVGAAPDANFILMRTEDEATEKHIEEFNWIRAMEKADSLGADIIHSSLGYSLFDTLEGDYTYFDMDGKSTFITRATDEAFKRGMFVTNSAGNSGEQPWKYITAPCDGKFVLCIGAVDSNEVKAGFSSFGPSADNRVKPEVMAMGAKATIINGQGYVATGNGTSFSGPIMAGFVACLKQAHPKVENYRLYLAIIQSADRYSTPDSAYGYGIPNILRADSILKVMATIKTPQKTKIRIYPNPGVAMPFIESDTRIDQYEIIDGLGKVIYQWQNGEAENKLIHLDNGVYTIAVTSMNSTSLHKWVKTSN
jgi:serine protease AprX